MIREWKTEKIIAYLKTKPFSADTNEKFIQNEKWEFYCVQLKQSYSHDGFPKVPANKFQSFWKFCKENEIDISLYDKAIGTTDEFMKCVISHQDWDLFLKCRTLGPYIKELQEDNFSNLMNYCIAKRQALISYCVDCSKLHRPKFQIKDENWVDFIKYCKINNLDLLRNYIKYNDFSDFVYRYIIDHELWELVLLYFIDHSTIRELSTDEFIKLIEFREKLSEDYSVLHYWNENVINEKLSGQAFEKYYQNYKLSSEQLEYLLTNDEMRYVSEYLKISKTDIEISCKNMCKVMSSADMIKNEKCFKLDAEGRAYILENQNWDFLCKYWNYNSDFFEIPDDKLESFIKFVERGNILSSYVNKIGISEERQKLFLEKENFYMIYFMLKYSVFSIKMNFEQSKKMISYIQENDLYITFKLFNWIDLSAELKKFAIDKGYWHFVEEVLYEDATEYSLQKNQICNFFINVSENCLKRFCKKSTHLKEYFDEILLLQDWHAFEKYMRCSMDTLSVTTSEFFWSFFRARKVRLENVIITKEIERDLFKAENLELFEAYIESPFEFDETREYLFKNLGKYGAEACAYAHKFLKANELTLGRKLSCTKFLKEVVIS